MGGKYTSSTLEWGFARPLLPPRKYCYGELGIYLKQIISSKIQLTLPDYFSPNTIHCKHNVNKNNNLEFKIKMQLEASFRQVCPAQKLDTGLVWYINT